MSPSRLARDRRDRAERGRLGAGEEDGDAEEVGVGHPLLRQPLEDRQPAVGPVDGEVGLFGQLRRRLRESTPTQTAASARPPRAARAGGGRRRGRCGRRRRRRRASSWSAASSEATAASLPPPPTGRSSSTLRPQCGSSPAWPASTAISRARRSAARLVLGAAPVQGLDRALVLAPQPGRVEVAGVEPGEEAGGVVLAPGQRGVGPGLLVARQQQLEAVVAGVGDPVEADQPARLGGPPPGDAADQAVALAQPGEHLARRPGTAASSARSTIGARVPSTSVRIAARGGSARSGPSSAAQAPSPVSDSRGTDLVSPHATLTGVVPSRELCGWRRSAPWRASSAASSESAAAP